ncbi:LPXTG cell wall anchor domain-containing protein [Staphylococcus sp. 170179]|uniref:LPXTG cell wall anchor domain-containing protein n=2 Tax=Staphylococcus borealis TaxID=2742203 RepID=A0ABX2LH53_9STAP|nr:LPXTG cell wall anchor domain-containing protein [Staphylococcus borealis]MUN94942.1 LPXTG cell wall anchor domain-containing protein [Staphylococcus borealis]NUI79133.1 LPXTG cell wall anchor domain-containing protein [Staphylococcus borealis]NUI81643.1 LPXTG cell wall anchor domain-containing protein [Staphylococcus borealis]NUI83880.1 LPXTG cell wall anchor domain-containing protein [Staphylococcus borealis]NUI91059.1 LPXTG cell wall anchor domain-containing protein [Staphylococcus borea
MSGTFVGYGFTKDSFAQSNDHANNASSEVKTVQGQLDLAIDKAKTKIDRLKHLKANEIKSYKQDIEDARNQSEIDQIVRDAQAKNRISDEESTEEADNNETPSTSKHSSVNEENQLDELDKIITDLNTLSEKVDTRQQKDGLESEETVNDHEQLSSDQPSTSGDSNYLEKESDDTSVLDKLDNLKNDVESVKDNQHTSVEDTEKDIESTTQDTQSAGSSSENTAQTHSDGRVINDVKEMDKEDVTNHHANTNHSESDALNALNDKLSATQKIDQAISKVEGAQDNTAERYSNRKLEQLRQLEQQVKQNQNLTTKQKQNVENDITNVRQDVKANRDTILDRLEQSKDKRATVDQIIGSVFSKNEAQHIAKEINTKGQSDKQITDQVMKQLDRLKTTTSDDILASMFDQAPDKEVLIKTLLSTRLGNSEASQIAKRLAKAQLSNSELVNKVKQEINAQRTVTADDILKDVLEKSSDRKQTIETLLATKLNQSQAKALADIIARAQTGKANTLDLVKNALNGTASDLLQLQNQLDNAKKKLNYILAPITQRPSLLDRINGTSNHTTSNSNLLNQGSHVLDGLTGGSLLNGLNSGGRLLDNIEDIPNPVQGLSLGHLGNDDGFLSGLFDDDGNISLPNTGEVVKKSWLPITMLLVVAGGTLIWLGRRKRHHTKH